jgi:hypothetical protein
VPNPVKYQIDQIMFRSSDTDFSAAASFSARLLAHLDKHTRDLAVYPSRKHQSL